MSLNANARISTLLLVVVLSTAGCVNTSSVESHNPQEPSIDSILTNITNKHPANYLLLASKFLEEGKYAEAAHWYYVGQIRYLAHLMTNSGLTNSSDIALYENYRSDVGGSIVFHAAKDIDHWLTIIDEALSWHQENENKFTPRADYLEVYVGVEQGISDLSNYIATNRALIRRMRNRDGESYQSRHQFWRGSSLAYLDKVD